MSKSKGKDKRKIKSKIKQILETKKSTKDLTKDNFKVSFQHVDTTQKYGSSYKDWQTVGLLSKTLETLEGYCCRPLLEQVDGTKFTIYGDFPPKDKTLFKLA